MNGLCRAIFVVWVLKCLLVGLYGLAQVVLALAGCLILISWRIAVMTLQGCIITWSIAFPANPQK